MATENLVRSTMALMLEAGKDDKGNVVIKRKAFNNVKETATSDQLYDIAQSLIALQQYPVVSIERTDTAEIAG
ncbi:DUF1659 domain-containing protein [Camelliibacillus cellulosilyticus]|uniref:DUF1659 domain-containing protein n=1 Tax=Camelliibacillus cellulosilyticus TaxID=2174486 RepID=A0ABV9GR10_9BACL